MNSEKFSKLLKNVEGKITFCKDCYFLSIFGNKVLDSNWYCKHPATFRYNLVTGEHEFVRCDQYRSQLLCEHFELRKEEK